MRLTDLIILLPVMFVLHEFEEIIFFEAWVMKNKKKLHERFPKVAKRILPHFEKLSTAAFTVAVAEEFVAICLITCLAFYFDKYELWLAIFMGFSIHLTGHILQWIAYRSYTLGAVTSLLIMPYCIYTLIAFWQTNVFTFDEIVLLSFAGIALLIVNIVFIHKMAARFDRWLAEYRTEH
jgi:hypothetical protein